MSDRTIFETHHSIVPAHVKKRLAIDKFLLNGEIKGSRWPHFFLGSFKKRAASFKKEPVMFKNIPASF